MGLNPDRSKKLSYEYELIMTCFHEVGHAVSGFLNLMFVSLISVEMKKDETSDNLGFTHYEYVIEYDKINDNDLLYQLVMSEIHMNYGGLAAEKIFYKDISGSDQLPMVLKYGSNLDRSHVSDLIKKYNLAPVGRKRYLFKQQVLKDCILNLEDVWGDVKMLSHLLFKKKKLSYNDLSNFLIKKSPNKDFWKKQFKIIDLLYHPKYALDEKEIKFIISNT